MAKEASHAQAADSPPDTRRQTESEVNHNMSNINSFPDWDAALAEYQTADDPAARTAFEIRLRAGRFLAAGHRVKTAMDDPAPISKERTAADKVNYERMIANGANGDRYLTFFTSLAELERIKDYEYTEVSFQELYDESLAYETTKGAVINPGGQVLALTRRNLNRLMDVARDAGQERFAARELSYGAQAANAWPPELQRAFADALSRRPEAREAYIEARNVEWREDSPELIFKIDFSGDGADLYAYLTEILKPRLDGVNFKFEKIKGKALRLAQATMPPVYFRPDISKLFAMVNAGKPPYPLFEHWDKETQAVRVNFFGARNTRETAEFESKIYTSHYYMPLNPNRKPKAVIYQEIAAAPVIPVFTNWDELGKMIKSGARVDVLPFPAIHKTVMTDARLGGVVINPMGKNLYIPRELMDKIHQRATGVLSGDVNMQERHFSAPKKTPPGLAGNLAQCLRENPDVYAVYYLTAEMGNAPHMPFLGVDFTGPEHLVFPLIEDAMRRSTNGKMTFTVAKADQNFLNVADALTQPIYVRDGERKQPASQIIIPNSPSSADRHSGLILPSSFQA
jgi:hypothetical protein